MLKIGTLVEHMGRGNGDIGVVIDTYPPTVYDNRLYTIQWQQHEAVTLEEEKSLRIIEQSEQGREK
jgi:hypothetical protein|tara:strand:- start:1067 stop:1264 length:198 start_codon:yes stop_codon:yes gene_type:complete